MSVISYVIDINSYFRDKKYPAQTLKVAGDLRRASGAFENPECYRFNLINFKIFHGFKKKLHLTITRWFMAYGDGMR